MSVEALQQIDSILLRELLKQVGSTAPDIELLDTYAAPRSAQNTPTNGNLIAGTIATSVTLEGEAQEGVIIEGKFLAASVPLELKTGDKILARLIDDGSAQTLKIVSVNPARALTEAALATLNSPSEDLLKFFEAFKDQLPVLRHALERVPTTPRTDLLDLPKLDLNLDSLKPVNNLLSSLATLSAKDGEITSTSLGKLATLLDPSNTKETLASLGRLVDIYSLLSSVETSSEDIRSSLVSLLSANTTQVEAEQPKEAPSVRLEKLIQLLASLKPVTAERSIGTSEPPPTSISKLLDSPQVTPQRLQSSLNAAESGEPLASLINTLEQTKATFATFQSSVSADTARFFDELILRTTAVSKLPLEDKQVQKVLSESLDKVLLRFGTATIPEFQPATPASFSVDTRSNQAFSAKYQLVIQQLVEQMTVALSSSNSDSNQQTAISTKGLLQTVTQINTAFSSRSPKAEELLLEFIDGLKQALKAVPLPAPAQTTSPAEKLSSIAAKALTELANTLTDIAADHPNSLQNTLGPEISTRLQQLELNLKALASPPNAKQAQSSADNVSRLLTLLGGLGDKLVEKPELSATPPSTPTRTSSTNALTQFVKDHMESITGRESQLRELLAEGESLPKLLPQLYPQVRPQEQLRIQTQVHPQALESLIKSVDLLESALKDSLDVKKQLTILTKGLENTLLSIPPEQNPDEESLTKLVEFSTQLEAVSRKLDIPARSSAEGSQNIKEVISRLREQLQNYIDKKAPLAQLLQLAQSAEKLSTDELEKSGPEKLLAVREVRTLLGSIKDGSSEGAIKTALSTSLNRIYQTFAKSPDVPLPQPTLLGADQPRAVQNSLKSITVQIRSLLLESSNPILTAPAQLVPPTNITPGTGAPTIAVPTLDELLASFETLKGLSVGLPQTLSAKLEAFIKSAELSFQQLIDPKSPDRLSPGKMFMGIKNLFDDVQRVSESLDDGHTTTQVTDRTPESATTSETLKKVTDGLRSLEQKLRAVGANIIDKQLMLADTARFSELSSTMAEDISENLQFRASLSPAPQSTHIANISTPSRERVAAAPSHEQALANLTQLLKRIESGPEKSSAGDQQLAETARKLLSQIERGGSAAKNTTIDIDRLQSSLTDLSNRFGSGSNGDPTQLAQNLTALKSLGNLIRGQEFINQLNPIMQAAGEPAFMLFPHLVQGILSKLEMSFFPAGVPNTESRGKQTETRTGQNEESDSADNESNQDDKDGKREPFRRISFTVTLPEAGAVQVDFAHSLNELLLNITVEDQGFSDLIQHSFYDLEKALAGMGYSKCQLSATRGIVQSVRPEWLETCLQLPTLIA